MPRSNHRHQRIPKLLVLALISVVFSIAIAILIFRFANSFQEKLSHFPPSTVITKASGPYAYKNTTNEFTTYFKAKATETNSIAFANDLGKISFYTPKIQSFGELNSNSIPTSKGSTLTYPDIYSQTDLSYTISTSRLLEEFIIKDKVTANKITRIKQIAQTNNQYKENADGSFTFTKGNKTVFTLPAPVLYEKEDNTKRSAGIKYEIEKKNNQLTISKVITSDGLAWLNDKTRVYPIVIDLVIDNADTAASWVSSDTTNTVVSQETTVKQEGTGAVKVQTTAESITNVDLMEFSSDHMAKAAATTSAITATGGTITYVGGYTIHSFTTSGTFTVTSGSGNVEVLVVAGGGGGGSDMGGGGGGGGVVYNSAYAVTPGAITTTVGNGGAGAAAGIGQNRGSNGQDSVFGTITAVGGGGGGSEYSTANNPPSNGGSGGGTAGSAGTQNAGTGTAGQGYAGGKSLSSYYPGGGGGAGGPGFTNPGNGGVGILSNINGTNLYWGGGGAGAGYSNLAGIGGLGGGGGGAPKVAVAGIMGGLGGNMALNSGSDGTVGTLVAQTNVPGGNGGANTGGGGGGGAHYNSNNYGGTGGSGIVIVRYPTAAYTQSGYVSNASGINATGGEITYSSGYKIHTIKKNDTFNVISGSGNVEVLVVAGGGGGGSDMGGGGGGGGVVYNSAYAVTPAKMAVTVGNGGAGAAAGTSQNRGSNGQDSVFGTITAVGGGGGGSEYSSALNPPSNGGSGGGTAGSAGTQNAGTGTAGQGYAGGKSLSSYYPGGGGGAGGVGGTSPGEGGIGYQSSINGTALYYGGGGAGAGYSARAGNGGLGGGGGGGPMVSGGGLGGGSALNIGKNAPAGTLVSQTNVPGGNGGVNTGGGGGGGSHYNSNNYGGTGGSGVVIVRYPIPPLEVFSSVGFSATGGTITTSGGNTIHTITSSGTFAVSTGSEYIKLLTVGGGGGGGTNMGGGGGAGGVVENSSYPITAGNYVASIGAGGAGAAAGIESGSGTSGNKTYFESQIAYGGGGGATNYGTNTSTARDGSSGGGNASGANLFAGFNIYFGQGNMGGQGVGNYYPGGGGGAGAAGIANPADGGVGVASSINGTALYYGGGGGGAGYTVRAGNGGLGGGGGGAPKVSGGGLGGGSALNSGSDAEVGTLASQTNKAGGNAGANTGGGGGAGSHYNLTNPGGNGGSGVVIVSYTTPTGTIKTEGSYALKVIAQATTSLNKTITRTIASPLNLSNYGKVDFSIRATRTGSNIKIGIHDTGGTTTEITPNITVANTFQTVTLDISNVSNVNKDAIDQIIVTVLNADATNTFYLDSMIASSLSVDDTVTLTKSADLSGLPFITFWVRSTVAGSYARFKFKEATGPEQTYDFTIDTANTWEKKTWSISSIPDADRNAITEFAFQFTSDTTGATFYFDNVNSNYPPATPTLFASYLHDKVKTSDTTPEVRFVSTDFESDDLVYQIEYDTNSSFTTATAKISSTDAGFANITTPADTSPFNAGDTISYTFQTPLTNNTTYFYRVRSADLGGSGDYTAWSTIRSLTIDTSIIKNEWFETRANQFSTDTLSNTTVSTAGNSIILFSQVINNADTVGNWVASDSSTSPISQETTLKQEGTGSVKIQTSSTNNVTVDFMEYSSDGNAQAAYASSFVGVSATGGTVTTSGSYTLHTYTSGTSSFTPSVGGNVEVLVVAGGGGGGQGFTGGGADGAGGGGGGGVIYNSAYAVTASPVTVTVGAGGPGNTTYRSGGNGSAGGNSVFSTLTAFGGGYGAGFVPKTGGSGGCGGGGGGSGASGGIGSQGSNGSPSYNPTYSGGGGGGMGGGTTGNSTGAAGYASSISGTTKYYGAGGGGGWWAGTYASPGGSSVGGNGAWNSGVSTAGATNTGSGGGGGGGNSTDTYAYGASGAAGIVIVRYPTSPVIQSFSESTIKTQGTYSLKGTAKATTSLNQTLTRTVSPVVDLSNNFSATFDIRSTRTGSNIKVGLHDSGGNTTEITPNITVADTFQAVTIDLSGVTNANKDAIDQIIITIINADADNTFYIDNFVSIRTSLNNTVSYTRSAIDLSTNSDITFWARSTLTGQTMRFQFGETDSSEQTYDITINSANTWERKTWDISGITASARNAVTQFAFKVTDSISAQTFYFDDINAKNATGSAMSTPITAANITQSNTWSTLLFTNEAGANHTFQIFYDASGTPTIIPDSALPGNSTGFTTSPVALTGLSAITYPTIYLKSNFSDSAYPTIPVLYDWGIILNNIPNIPTLESPADGAIGIPLNAILSTKTTDIDPTDVLKFKITICRNPAMTTSCVTYNQVAVPDGWDEVTYASNELATYTLVDDLIPNTTYYWKSYAIDPNGTNTWSETQTTPRSFTTNIPPNIPTLDLPADAATDVTITTVFKTTATDPESNVLKYKIKMCTDPGMNLFCHTFDQTVSQVGWSGQDIPGGISYASGTQATYTVQENLPTNTTYYWKSYAVDTYDSNAWSATQATPYSFTTFGSPSAPAPCSTIKALDNSSITINWTDTSTNEDKYQLWKVTDGSLAALLDGNLAPNTIQYIDSAVLVDHSYAYQIRSLRVDGSNTVYSGWCSTASTHLNTAGSLFMEGINLD